MTFDIVLAIFLVLLNGFFVAAEFAIVKVRTSQIAIQTGNLSKKAAEVILGNLDGFLAATQLGITLASLGLGWVGEDVVSALILSLMEALNLPIDTETAHRIALPVAFAVITFMHIIFGELAPKSIAIRYPTPTTLAIAIPMRIFYVMFKPIIYVLNGFANIILRLFGIKPIGEHDIHSEEELKLIIAESEEGGAIEHSERELIQNVFDFDDRIVKQVMIPRMKITGIQAKHTVEEAVRIVMKEGYSRYPVYEKNLDEIVGIIHSKDVMQNHFEQSGKTLKEITRPVFYVTENKQIDHLLRDFQKKKVQFAVVISEYGGTLGIVTMEDIIEELVGEIQDEHDHETQVVTTAGTDNFHVVATSSLHDINKYIDPPFRESEEYDTLAGLILAHKPSDLKEGDMLMVDEYEVIIRKMNKSLPELVDIRLLTNSKETSE